MAELADALDLGSDTTVEFSPAAIGQVKNNRKLNMWVWRNWQTHQIWVVLLQWSYPTIKKYSLTFCEV